MVVNWKYFVILSIYKYESINFLYIIENKIYKNVWEELIIFIVCKNVIYDNEIIKFF